MTSERSFASIRQGDVVAAQAWELLVPVVDTEDQVLAASICDVLRSWTWKALDRRRRDSALREWIDLLNRVEAFFADRFAHLAAKIELLTELLHESLAVAELASPEDLLRRKHVASILTLLRRCEGEWVERVQLMGELDLRPANMTRLMTLLLDVGWVEQAINGREAAYRISAEGVSHARGIERQVMPEFDEFRPEFEDVSLEAAHIRSNVTFVRSMRRLHILSVPAYRAFDPREGAAKWKPSAQEAVGAFKIVAGDEEDEGFIGGPRMTARSPKLAVVGGGRW